MVDLEGEVCSGGWRFLCAGMMLQAVQRLEAEHADGRQPNFTTGSMGGNVKEAVYQRRDARNWIDGGIGVVTFEDCCEALNVDAERARRMIDTHCQQPGKRRKRSRH